MPKNVLNSGKRIYANIAVLFILGIHFHVHASEWRLFPTPQKGISAETLPYTHMLHADLENDAFYMRGRFGVDFPIVGYDLGRFTNGDDVLHMGITAAAHINMRPESGMKFPVDNFYAVLALHLSGVHGRRFSWRLYPVYHVSAHLADGYPDDILKENVRPVSSEMVRGEVYYKPLRHLAGLVEFGAGAGYYYHVCAQKNLRGRGDASILVTPNTLIDNTLQPYFWIRGESVYMEKHNLGIDISAGIIAMNNGRALGLSLRYFNRLHSSYYFEERERGWGIELTFM